MIRLAIVGACLLAVGCSVSQETAASSAAAETNGGGDLIALEGEYKSAGDVDPMQRLTVDVVDTRMADSAKRLSDLEGSGASCFAVFSTTYRCTSLTKDVPQSSLDKIAKGNTFKVTFNAETVPPSLTSQAEDLTEWSVPQSGVSSAGSFDGYRYLILEGGLVKIVLQDGSNAGQGTELIVQDAKHLGKYASTTVGDGQWRWFEDSALVVLE